MSLPVPWQIVSPVSKRGFYRVFVCPTPVCGFFSVLRKDSLDITETERASLVEAVRLRGKEGAPVVVLHGTDTMVESAARCLKEIPNPLAPVVFTGAMSPMGFEDSDAAQNVTEALLAAKLLPAGVYVCFHNRVFQVPNVAKNPRLGTFEVVG